MTSEVRWSGERTVPEMKRLFSLCKGIKEISFIGDMLYPWVLESEALLGKSFVLLLLPSEPYQSLPLVY